MAYIQYHVNEKELSEIYESAIVKYDKDIVNLIMCDQFNYIHSETKQESTTLRINRIGQKDFRSALIDRYMGCVVTGDEPDLCEACHIIPYSESKNCDVDNGLLMTATFHKLFDTYRMTIDSATSKVRISNSMPTRTYNNYKVYDNQVIRGLSKITKDYLADHNKRFSKHNK
jgi:predicted restriction endonuclease